MRAACSPIRRPKVSVDRLISATAAARSIPAGYQAAAGQASGLSWRTRGLALALRRPLLLLLQLGHQRGLHELHDGHTDAHTVQLDGAVQIARNPCSQLNQDVVFFAHGSAT